MHLVGFIIRIYHDARSPERQMCQFYILILLQFSTNKIHNTSYHRQQNSRLLTHFEIGVKGILHDLKFMYTTCNQSFKFISTVKPTRCTNVSNLFYLE